jgi:hypothetical protein
VFENSCNVLRAYDVRICIGVGRILNIGSTAFKRLYILRGMHRRFRLCKGVLELDMYALRVLLIRLLDRRSEYSISQ